MLHTASWLLSWFLIRSFGANFEIYAGLCALVLLLCMAWKLAGALADRYGLSWVLGWIAKIFGSVVVAIMVGSWIVSPLHIWK